MNHEIKGRLIVSSNILLHRNKELGMKKLHTSCAIISSLMSVLTYEYIQICLCKAIHQQVLTSSEYTHVIDRQMHSLCFLVFHALYECVSFVSL